MEEIILQILLDNTEYTSLYNGGNEEPSVISFKESEGCDMKSFLSELSNKISAEVLAKLGI